MKKLKILIALVLIMLISACTNNHGNEDVELPGNDISAFTETEGDKIPVTEVRAPYSKTKGHIDAFSKYEKRDDEFFLTFESSMIKTHQFIFEFEYIYPIDKIYFTNDNLEKMHIEISMNGESFNRVVVDYPLQSGLNIIDFSSNRASTVRFVFDTIKQYTIKDVYFTLDLGVITKLRPDLFDAFYNLNGWTGADGIFSFNLDGSVGLNTNSKSAFIFSDTLIGEVYPHNNLRKNMDMINNSMAYFDPNKPLEEAVTYVYNNDNPNKAASTFLPDAYIGKDLRNLLDSDGLDISYDKNALLAKSADGTQYLTHGDEATIIIDLKDTYEVDALYIWNYNETPNLGTKEVEVSISTDNVSYEQITTLPLEQASGHDGEPYTLKVDLNESTRYIQIKLSNEAAQIGLGKLLILDNEQNPLFGSISGTQGIDTLTDLDQTARLWLQDGVVIEDKLYIYPILVKDLPDIFKVYSVGVIEVPIINDTLDYQSAIYHQSPLQTRPPGGGEIFYGAGILNHSQKDGYIYIYGYKDLNGRRLTVGRYKPEDVLNFNNYEYFDGTNFQKDINKSAPLIIGVSAELSVTYIEEGLFEGQYMLVVMENTTSGRISYALADNPYGPFNDYVLLYETPESNIFNDAFTYNAKMQTTLSKSGAFVISYNVNSNSLTALQNALIYYPRFIEIIEVKRKD